MCSLFGVGVTNFILRLRSVACAEGNRASATYRSLVARSGFNAWKLDVSLSNGKFSIATRAQTLVWLGSTRVGISNEKFSIVTAAEIQIWLNLTGVGISNRHLRKSMMRALPLLLAYAIALVSTFFFEMLSKGKFSTEQRQAGSSTLLIGVLPR